MTNELWKNSIIDLIYGYKKKHFSPYEVAKETINNIFYRWT